MKVAALLSSGKDSNLTIYYYLHQGWEIATLLSIIPNDTQSWMFQKPLQKILDAQSKCMQIPLMTYTSLGEKEKELHDLKNLIQEAQKKYNIEGIIVGALASDYQQERVNRICHELNLKTFAPLWHVKQETIMQTLIIEGFDIRMTSIAALGLDSSWIGKKLTLDDIEKLKNLNKKYGLHIAGEGGEFETIVLDAPFYKNKIIIAESSIKKINEHEAFWDIQRITLGN